MYPQHQVQGVNGIPISGRGRPASVEVDTSHSVHEIQQTIKSTYGSTQQQSINKGKDIGH